MRSFFGQIVSATQASKRREIDTRNTYSKEKKYFFDMKHFSFWRSILIAFQRIRNKTLCGLPRCSAIKKPFLPLLIKGGIVDPPQPPRRSGSQEGNRGTYHFLQSDIPSLTGRTDEGERDLGLEIDKYFTKQTFLSRMRAVKWHSFKKTFVNPGPYLRDLYIFSPSLFFCDLDSPYLSFPSTLGIIGG